MKRLNFFLLIIGVVLISSLITFVLIDRSRIIQVNSLPMDVNVTEEDIIGINVDPDGVHFGSLGRGQGAMKLILINDVKQDAIVSIIKKGGMAKWVSSPRGFIIHENEDKNILKKREKYVSIPALIFNNSLSPLENVVMYMEISVGLNQTQIAAMLNRDHTTIWTTLENANGKIKKSKYKEFLEGLADEKILIPVSVFANRELSILESLSIYIKDKFEMSYHEIALMLGKNDRTIWTVVNRARKKLK